MAREGSTPSRCAMGSCETVGAGPAPSASRTAGDDGGCTALRWEAVWNREMERRGMVRSYGGAMSFTSTCLEPSPISWSSGLEMSPLHCTRHWSRRSSEILASSTVSLRDAGRASLSWPSVSTHTLHSHYFPDTGQPFRAIDLRGSRLRTLNWTSS